MPGIHTRVSQRSYPTTRPPSTRIRRSGGLRSGTGELSRLNAHAFRMRSALFSPRDCTCRGPVRERFPGPEPHEPFPAVGAPAPGGTPQRIHPRDAGRPSLPHRIHSSWMQCATPGATWTRRARPGDAPRYRELMDSASDAAPADRSCGCRGSRPSSRAASTGASTRPSPESRGARRPPEDSCLRATVAHRA